MRIRDGIKLNFDDVFLVPQRSTLKSRKDIVLEREFQFYHSPRKLICKPIFSSNMYATGSMQIGRELAKENMLTCLHKFYTREELVSFFSEDDKYKELVFVSIGQSDKDIEKISDLGFEPNIRIDVANGYREVFVEFCKKVRDKFPNSIILGGNVCSSEIVQELIIHGKVDVVCIGIGPGCFVKGTKVVTSNGKSNIESVKIGERVLTHTGEYKKVTAKLTRLEDDDLISINDIVCTKKHEFYVVDKANIAIITEKNYHLYARWVSAEDLSDDYFLLKITN